MYVWGSVPHRFKAMGDRPLQKWRDYMRKLVLLVLAAVIMFIHVPSMGSYVQANVLPDLKPQGREEIGRLIQEEIISGFPDGTFKPDQRVTRAEAITMIGRALQFEANERTSRFSDVPNNHFAVAYITEGVEKGLVSGYPNGTFQPNQPVTRAEMAMFLSRAYSFQTTSSNYFLDVSSNVQGSQEINRMAATGITTGYPNGTYLPNQGITRHEFSLLLARAHFPVYRVTPRQPLPDVPIKMTKAVVYNAPDGLNIRPEPNTNNEPIDRLANGTLIEYFAVIDNWALFFHNGNLAYASLSFLTTPTGIKGKTIVVDPGHGGTDPGAVRFGLQEKDLVLAVGLIVQKKLEAAGANVVMTRTTDRTLSLSDRSSLANRVGADAFVSIHANSAPSATAHGTETYWNRTNAASDSKALAENIQKHLISKLKTRDRGVKEAGFHVIKNTTMPSVLVELGFISNQQEAEKMKTAAFQEDAAEAIYLGLKEFFKD